MTYLVQWWPINEPIPKGWRKARCRVSHHQRYSILLVKATKRRRRSKRGRP